MLKKLLYCLLGIVIGNVVALCAVGLISFFSKTHVETRRFQEALSLFKYSVFFHLLQIFIFVLIMMALGKIFKTIFVKPESNFFIVGVIYSIFEPLLSNYVIMPLFERSKSIHLLMEYLSKLTHLPMLSIMSVTIIPFSIFLFVIFVHNRLFLKN